MDILMTISWIEKTSRITYEEINWGNRIVIKILKSYNWKTYKSFMNYLFPRFNCFCKFSRSHFKRNYEYIDVSSIFYFFSFVGFSHRDVWKFDILFSSHYRRCVTGVLQLRQMLQQWMYLLWPIASRKV